MGRSTWWGVAAVSAVVLAAAWFLLRESDVPAPPPPNGPVPSEVRRPSPIKTPTPAASPEAVRTAPHTAAAPLRASDIVVSGYVFDERGTPVDGALAELLVDVTTTNANFMEGDVRASTRTAAGGAFHFDSASALSLDERYLLRFSHDEFATERLWPIDPRAPATCRRDATLYRTAASIGGRVTDEKGAPVVGAKVAVLDLAVQSKTALGAVERTTSTDPDGGYRFASLRAGVKTVRVTADGLTSAAWPDFNLAEGVKAQADFVLSRGLSIEGRIFGTDFGAGLAGALVTARLLQLEGPTAAPARVAPKSDGEKAREFQRRLNDAKERAAKGETEPLEPDYAPEDPVPDETTPPEAASASMAEYEAAVDRNARASKRRSPVAVAVADAEGRFVLAGLEAGAYELWVRAPGYREPEKRAALAGGASQDFELDPNGRMSGTVTDAETGLPVERFTLTLVSGPEQRLIPWSMKRRFAPPASKGGVFEYLDVRAGRWQLMAEADGYAGGRSDLVEMRQGERAERLVIRLTRGASVSGRAVDSAGRAIAGATVELDSAELGAGALGEMLARGVRRDRRTTTTDRSGRYVFENVLAGAFVTRATSSSHAGALGPPFAVPDAGAVEAPDLVMPRGAAVFGRVVLRDGGGPDADATVRVIATGDASRSGTSVEATTDSEGRFTAGGLAPGSYRIAVVRRNGQHDFAGLFARPGHGADPAASFSLEDGQELDLGDR